MNDLIEIEKTNSILKIAIYHFSSSQEFIYPKITHLQNEVLLKISGQHSLDISDEKANKGNALKEIQKMLKITKEETLVFGEYHNDIEMLKEVHFSFAMKNVHKDIKKITNFSTESNTDLGVEKILKKLIEAIKLNL